MKETKPNVQPSKKKRFIQKTKCEINARHNEVVRECYFYTKGKGEIVKQNYDNEKYLTKAALVTKIYETLTIIIIRFKI